MFFFLIIHNRFDPQLFPRARGESRKRTESTRGGVTWRGLPMNCIQTVVLEPAANILVCHLSQRASDDVVEIPFPSGLYTAEEPFDLRERFLNRRIIRAERRQSPHTGATPSMASTTAGPS